MKKKITSRNTNYFTNEGIPIYLIKSKDDDLPMLTELKADTGILKRVCNDEEIKKVEKKFNKFYKLVFDYSIDKEAQESLERLKEHIKQTYFIYMYNLIDNKEKKDSLNNNVLKNDKLKIASRQLFFLADLVIGFVIGDENTLKMMKERFGVMTGKKLPEEKRKVLIKIVNKRNELRKIETSSHKFSWRVVINKVYSQLSEKEKRYLLGQSSIEHKNIDLPIKLTNSQIKTISGTISYHQDRDNLRS